MSFYRELIAIFVTFFAGLCPSPSYGANPTVKTSVPQEDCSKMLVVQTKIVKKALKNPVDLYFEILHRYQKHLKETGSENFPAEDLYVEDFEGLYKGLVEAKKYFQVAGQNRSFLAVGKMIERGDELRKNGYGNVDFDEFSKTCLSVFDIVEDAKLFQRINYPGFPVVPRRSEFHNPDKMRSEHSIMQIEEYLSHSSPKQPRAALMLPHYQFKQIQIPTISTVDRLDMLLVYSVPFAIRRLAFVIEVTDRMPQFPTSNGEHDDIHASLRTTDPADGIKLRFSNETEFHDYLNEKFAATKYIVQKIRQTRNKIERLRLEQMAFNFINEVEYASIEYFSPNYASSLLVSGGFTDDTFVLSNLFLSKEEEDLLALHPETPADEKIRFEKIQRWYREGGGL